MTITREAFVLPLLLLTVALLGGFRVAGAVQLVPPTLVGLALAAALLGTLIRAGALAPERLLHGSRTPLENFSGAIVIAALFAASTQIFNLLIPERGLLFAVFSIYFFIQIMTALAGATTRESLLRSLTVLFAAAFLLRFAVLESIYAPHGGLLARLMTVLLQGISLGSMEYQPHAPITGYVGFLTLVLYLVALALLPGRRGLDRQALIARHQASLAGQVLLVMLAVSLTACGGGGDGEGYGEAPGAAAVAAAAARRADALRAAQVWHQPAVPIGDVDTWR